jgi:hypothetical protein
MDFPTIQPMDFINLRNKICDPKVSRLLPNVLNFQKENHTLGYGFKIYRKSVAYRFLFFVISISEEYLQRSFKKTCLLKASFSEEPEVLFCWLW